MKDFSQDRYKIKEGDCNTVIDEILSEVPKMAPCFTFIDPEGFEVDWSTYERIANYKKDSKTKIELFILFPYNMAITRLLPLDRKKFDEEKAISVFNRILPDNSWLTVYNDRVKGRIKSREMRKHTLDIFTNGLKKLGYKFVQSRQKKVAKVVRYMICFLQRIMKREQILWSMFLVRIGLEAKLPLLIS